jgi:hypothetical protein
MQRDIADLLEAIAPPGSFAVQLSAPAEALRIEVTDVGPLALPVSPRTVSRLLDAAQPSRYGFRERTLLDRKVRDSSEIPAKQIRIDQPRWNETLLPLLEEIRAGLGLAEGIELTAELHNMLVYGRGQFFRQHQDSEKSDDMIGTLVVTLPSQFRGGELTVEQNDEVMTFRGSRTALQLVAFYADCRHEVEPVTSGARVVLTYNLLAKGMAGATPPAIDARNIDALAGAMERHFQTPAKTWSGGDDSPPDRLVYLLDHEYTARGLRWDLLKGADAPRAAVLAAAAERLDCAVFLAQADVHETWECEADWDQSYRHSSWRDDDNDEYDGGSGDDDEDGDHPDEGDLTLSNLIDSDIELRSWVASDSIKPAAISSIVDDKELCYTRPSVDLRPFQREYTGYMGNWGNTLDRWYHRAAIVLWPREREFVLRARASPSWALKDVLNTLRGREKEQARRKVDTLLPFWAQVARSWPEALMADALRVADGVGEPGVASALLRPLPLETLDARTTPLFVPLLAQFGQRWSRETLSALSPSGADEARVKWLTRFPALCEALCGEGERPRALARWLVGWQWEWLQKKLADAESRRSPALAAAEMGKLVTPFTALLESTAVVDAPHLQETFVDGLTSARTEQRVGFLTALLRATSKGKRHDRLELVPVYELCTRWLAESLDAPPRAPSDWSIVADLGCRCRTCSSFGDFLRSPARKMFEWPLAEPQREHVHTLIRELALPVTHQTRRTGRPYTLVLSKQDALFTRDAARRQRWQEDLEWLRHRGR